MHTIIKSVFEKLVDVLSKTLLVSYAHGLKYLRLMDNLILLLYCNQWFVIIYVLTVNLQSNIL